MDIPHVVRKLSKVIGLGECRPPAETNGLLVSWIEEPIVEIATVAIRPGVID